MLSWYKNPETKFAYELSSRGAIVRYLQRHFKTLETSEYFENIAPGQSSNNIRCEDIQNLTYPDSIFDLLTSTEVFEHVPDDSAGFREIIRVLKSGGYFIFTVPLSNKKHTVERARLVNGVISHTLDPQYDGDKIRGQGKVLVFRDYGADIVERLLACGFSEAWIKTPATSYFGYSRKIVIAKT